MRAPLSAKSRARKTRALTIAPSPFEWLPRGCERADLPRTEAELLARARKLAGYTVADLALQLDRPLPSELSRAKGLVGDLVECVLGADRAAGSAPDFPALGIELKTVPVTPALVPAGMIRAQSKVSASCPACWPSGVPMLSVKLVKSAFALVFVSSK